MENTKEVILSDTTATNDTFTSSNPSTDELEKIIDEYKSKNCPDLSRKIPLVRSFNVAYQDCAVDTLKELPISKGKYISYWQNDTTEHIMYHSYRDEIWDICIKDGNFVSACKVQNCHN